MICRFRLSLPGAIKPLSLIASESGEKSPHSKSCRKMRLTGDEFAFVARGGSMRTLGNFLPDPLTCFR